MTQRCPRLVTVLASAALLSLWTGAPAQKQKAAASAPAAAKKVLWAAIVAMNPAPYSEVRFISYGTGSLKDSTLRIEGLLRIMSQPNSQPPWIRLEANSFDPSKTAAQALRIASVSDGDNVTIVSEGDQTVWQSVKHRGGDLLFTAKTNMFLSAITQPMGLTNLFQYEANVGKEVVAGVPCAVVRFPLPGGGGYTYRFGTKDHRPRSLEWDTVKDGTPGARIMEVVSWTKPPAPPRDSFLTLTPNKGYPVKEYTFGGPAVGEAAPSWKVTDKQFGTLTLASFAGKVLLMDFWATWCGPCQASLPKLKALADEFRNRHLKVVGFTWMESGDAAAYLKKMGVRYPTFPGDAIAKPYGVDKSGIPTVFVIGPDGKVADYFIGYEGDETDKLLRQAVKKALADH